MWVEMSRRSGVQAAAAGRRRRVSLPLVQEQILMVISILKLMVVQEDMGLYHPLLVLRFNEAAVVVVVLTRVLITDQELVVWAAEELEVL
jgi:hypothetical protein